MNLSELVPSYFEEWDHITVRTAMIRLVRDVGLPLIQLSIEEHYDIHAGKRFIDPSCSRAIQNLIQEYQIPLNVYEKALCHEIKRQDFHDPEFVEEFAKMLQKKFAHSGAGELQIQKIFGVDGLGDQDLVKNIVNLEYGLAYEVTEDVVYMHVRAVRELYDLGKTPGDIRETLLEFYNRHGDEETVKLYKTALRPKNETEIDEVRKYIESRLKETGMLPVVESDRENVSSNANAVCSEENTSVL